MDNNYMIFYKIIDGRYEPIKYGANIVPTENIDKVIQVPEEIANQAHKFDFDGKTLKRKDGEYIMDLEQYYESIKQRERQSNGETLSDNSPSVEKENDEINIEF